MELYLDPQIEKSKRNSAGQFLPGSTPWNKGKKIINQKKSNTQFKPGHLPANTKFDGYITKRYHIRDKKYYRYIRISKGNWQLLNRYVYKQHFGSIPKNHVIAFIDGDTMNCNIENLQCISRADNMRRNQDRKKAAKSQKETWRKDKLREKYGLPTKTKWFNK